MSAEEARAEAERPVDVERLKAVGQAATPGPWTYDGSGEDEPEINYWAHRFIRSTEPDASGYYREIATSEDGHGPNAEFIVHARNYWDGMIAEIESLRQASREVTDAKVLAALNAKWRVSRGFVRFPDTRNATSLNFFAAQTVAEMRAALEAAREVRS